MGEDGGLVAPTVFKTVVTLGDGCQVGSIPMLSRHIPRQGRGGCVPPGPAGREAAGQGAAGHGATRRGGLAGRA